MFKRLFIWFLNSVLEWMGEDSPAQAKEAGKEEERQKQKEAADAAQNAVDSVPVDKRDASGILRDGDL